MARPVPSKFKITHVIFVSQQPGAKRPRVRPEIGLKSFFAWPDVSQNLAFIIGQRNDRPFIEHGLLVAGIHLLGASLYQPSCLANCHSKFLFIPPKQAIPTPSYKPNYPFPIDMLPKHLILVIVLSKISGRV